MLQSLFSKSSLGVNSLSWCCFAGQSALYFSWRGKAKTGNSRDFSFRSGHNAFYENRIHLVFPSISFMSLFWGRENKPLPNTKRNLLWPFWVISAHGSTLFNVVLPASSMKDWGPLLYLTKSRCINFWCFFIVVYIYLCVLLLPKVFRFAVDIRSLNSSLTDFVPWLNFKCV